MERRLDPTTVLLGLLALYAGVNGLAALFAAGAWYARVAHHSGAFNVHFVRDVGAAFTACGVAFAFAALRPGWRGGLLLAPAVFLGTHAAVHAVETWTHAVPHAAWSDLAGVHAPALVAVVLAGRALAHPARPSAALPRAPGRNPA